MTRVSFSSLMIGALLIAGCPAPQTAPKGESAPAQPAAANAPNAPSAPNAPPSAANPPSAPPPVVAPPAIAPKPPSKIKIIVRSIPPKANVRWGKKVLGQTPFTLERPRDSGPVDLIVLADGFFPVHARAYTFRNDIFTVKLTKAEDRMTLFGAKQELEAPQEHTPPDSLAAPPPENQPPPALAPLEANPNQ
jgi:hypothetical protein